MIAAARARIARLVAGRGPQPVGPRQAVNQWYAARSPREQRLFAVLGIVAAVVAIMLLAVRPLLAARADAFAQIHDYSTLETQLRAAGPSGLAVSPKPVGNPATVIPQAAQAFGLTLQRMEPEGRRTRVTLEDVPFEMVLGWLAQLDAQGVPAAEIRIQRSTTPGLIGVQMLLGR